MNKYDYLFKNSTDFAPAEISTYATSWTVEHIMLHNYKDTFNLKAENISHKNKQSFKNL